MSSKLVYDGPLTEFALSLIPHAGDFGPHKAIGVESGGSLIGVCVYHNYIPDYGTCEISMASTSPMWCRYLRPLLSVPFDQYGCHLVQTITPHDLTGVIRFNQKIGMTVEGMLRHRYGAGRHAVVASMTKDEFHKRYGITHG